MEAERQLQQNAQAKKLGFSILKSKRLSRIQQHGFMSTDEVIKTNDLRDGAANLLSSADPNIPDFLASVCVL